MGALASLRTRSETPHGKRVNAMLFRDEIGEKRQALIQREGSCCFAAQRIQCGLDPLPPLEFPIAMLKRDHGWSVRQADELYGVSGWGEGYFEIDEHGQLGVRPSPDSPRHVNLLDLVDRLQASGADLPVLIRFNDLLEARMQQLADAFTSAIADGGYQGDYRCVFPIKVNQQQHVVQRVVQSGRRLGFGLEAGSKAELLAVMAVADDETPIVCNGFKDARYIETAVMGMKLGRQLTVVIEKFTELELLIRIAQKYDVRPGIGVRVKLAARGAGRWQASGGYHSKFGLTVGEITAAVERLQAENLADCFHLLHFHLGSQITDIRHVKAALIEATRVYAHLLDMGAGLKCIDCGGGLGVDYDGSQSAGDSSMNYSLQEYANDVVYYIQQVCDDHGAPHPDIITESGRAIAAHHSVLVVNVMGVAGQVSESDSDPPRIDADDHDAPQPLRILQMALDNVVAENLVESFHDGQQALDMAMTLFGVGHLSLQQRMIAEQQYWRLCRRIFELQDSVEDAPDELRDIDDLLTDTYFCNFSLFQSLPDSWAINQVFPIAPIHRLNEAPTRRGVLGDITCDSDGKIAHFRETDNSRSHLPLHELRDGEPYYLGIFLVGAYQETLGDLHNLFGDTNAAHIDLLENGEVSIQTIIKGDTVNEVLGYVQFDAEHLQERIHLAIGEAIRAGRLDRSQGHRFRQLYESGLSGYTYLESPSPNEPARPDSEG